MPQQPDGKIPAVPPETEKTDYRLAFQLAQIAYTESVIQFADTKAGAIIAMSSAIMGWLIVSRLESALTVLNQAATGLEHATAITLLFALISLSAAIGFSMWVVWPRLRPPYVNPSGDGLWWPPHVMRWKLRKSAHFDEVDKATQQCLWRHAMEVTYVHGLICSEKYRWLFWALRACTTGIIFSALHVVMAAAQHNLSANVSH